MNTQFKKMKDELARITSERDEAEVAADVLSSLVIADVVDIPDWNGVSPFDSLANSIRIDRSIDWSPRATRWQRAVNAVIDRHWQNEAKNKQVIIPNDQYQFMVQ